MDDLLPMLVSRCRNLRHDPLRVLDVACSAGVSTIELHRALIDGGLHPQTFGTDLMTHADYVVDARGVGILFDHAGNHLQIDIGTWASSWRWRRRDIVCHPWLSLRGRRVIASDLDRFRAALGGSRDGFTVTCVPLLASVATDAADVSFHEEDVMDPVIPGEFSLVRAANLLNPSYFDADGIRRIGAALARRLAPGGLLLVCRTESAGMNRGTLFTRKGIGLEVVEQVNGGSEVQELLSSIPA